MSSSEEDLSEDEDYVPEEISKSDEDDDPDNDIQDESADTTQEESFVNKDEKNKIDELWNSFKKDTEKITKKPEANGKLENGSKTETPTSVKNSKEVSPRKDSDTVTITKVYDFAGEEVKVTKQVKKDSTEALNHFKEQSHPVSSKAGILGRSALGGSLKKKATGGIGNVLGRLGKKPKLSTLEKSKLDWMQYKEEEGIEEELQAYNKGKEGYLEKVSFLERTEMRQFERERDMRLKQSSKR